MEKIEALCATCNLGRIKGTIQQVSGGLLHTMYHVCTEQGEYAIKWLNPDIMKRPDAMQNMINSEQIAHKFLGVVPLIAAKSFGGRHVIESGGDYYLIYDWLEGRSIFVPEITEYHCTQIGRILGQIHSANAEVRGVMPNTEARGIYDWDTYLNLAGNQQAECYHVLKQNLDRIKRIDETIVRYQQEILQNQVISHRDLDPKNVMWNQGQAYLIDWEAAGYVNPFQELLEVLNYWIADKEGNYQRKYFDALLSAYMENCKVSGVNWEAVMACSFDGMLGWLEYNVKRALGLEGSKKEDCMEGNNQAEATIEELKKYELQISLLMQWIKDAIKGL